MLKKQSIVTTSFLLLLGMNPGQVQGNSFYCDEEYVACEPVNQRDWHVNGIAEYLLWRTNIQNVYAADIYTADEIPHFSVDKNDTYHETINHQAFNNDFESGFRLGLGLDLPCNRWSVVAAWTYYQSTAHYKGYGEGTIVDSSSVYINNVSMPVLPYSNTLFGDFAVIANSGILESKWKFNYNQVDLTFYKRFDLGCYATFTPYLGIRGLFVKNRVCSLGTYDNITPPGSGSVELGGPTLSASLAEDVRSNFNSVGLTGGLASTWEIKGGFGLYGNFGLSLLYSRYSNCNNLKNVLTYIPGAEEVGETKILTNFASSPNHIDALKLMTDLAFGISWEKSVNCDRNRFFVRAGWEHHLILQGNEFQYLNGIFAGLGNESGGIASITNQSRSIAGDIALYGLTVSVGFSY